MTADRGTGAQGTTMRRWMRVVGGLFVVLGVGLLPWLNKARTEVVGLESLYDGGDLSTDATAYSYVLDWAGVFGLSLLVLGGVLLVAARSPIRNRALAHLVIWHELAVGVVGDAWFISRDYVPGMAETVYAGFIVVHLAIALTGLRALRRTPMPGTAPTPAPIDAEVGRW